VPLLCPDLPSFAIGLRRAASSYHLNTKPRAAKIRGYSKKELSLAGSLDQRSTPLLGLIFDLERWAILMGFNRPTRA